MGIAKSSIIGSDPVDIVRYNGELYKPSTALTYPYRVLKQFEQQRGSEKCTFSQSAIRMDWLVRDSHLWLMGVQFIICYETLNIDASRFFPHWSYPVKAHWFNGELRLERRTCRMTSNNAFEFLNCLADTPILSFSHGRLVNQSVNNSPFGTNP